MICCKIQIEIPEENKSLVLKVNACARTKWRPNCLGDLISSQLPIGDQNEPFWTPLGRHGHLGRHYVARAMWFWHLHSPLVVNQFSFVGYQIGG